MIRRTPQRGFSLVEVVVAFAISLVCFGGLIYFATSTRTETSKAENYLRALQIAQETIELIQSTPAEELTPAKLQMFEGSLVNPASGKSVTLPVHPSAAWQPTDKTYPDQYTKAYFYRKIKLKPVESGIPNSRFLKQVTVEVFWNEGKTPDKIEAIGGDPDRMRKLSLPAVIFDEREPY